MKYFALIIIFSFNPFTLHAQSEEQKRPSWSQGLPERQKAPTANSINLDFDSRDQSESQVSSLDSVSTESPKFELESIEIEALDGESFGAKSIDMEKFKVPEIEYQAEPSTINPPASEQIVRLDSLSKNRNRSIKYKPTNPLHKQYKWQVLSTTPIEMPTHLSSNENITVKIFIKPDGSVSKVTSSDPNLSSLALNYVSDSIEKWLFEAPSKLGINDVMSKNFSIEIKS